MQAVLSANSWKECLIEMSKAWTLETRCFEALVDLGGFTYVEIDI